MYGGRLDSFATTSTECRAATNPSKAAGRRYLKGELLPHGAGEIVGCEVAVDPDRPRR
jgi:hypothetical protein